MSRGLEEADTGFGNTILEVSINSTEIDSLIAGCTSLDKPVIGELPIICSIMKDGNTKCS